MEKPKVRLINDPILRQKMRSVQASDQDQVKELIPVMLQVMREENGIGLAANQIGVDLALFVLGVEGKSEEFLNPEVLDVSSAVEFEEGCLSIPGVTATTKRFNKLTLRWTTLVDLPLGTRKEETFEGIKAIAIQHEMDHLNGKLYIDQFGPLKRSMVLDKHRKFLRHNRR